METEVLIIGGSYSGMAAAMALGRALRKVTIIDAGKPCNRFATHAHNLLGSDGLPPEQLHASARRQLQQYKTIELIEDLALEAQSGNDTFTVKTQKGHVIKAQRLLLATGLKDNLPPITGLKECWGKSAIHCPYCHGYEFKAEKTGILASSNEALHMISLLLQWTNQLFVFTTDGFSFNQAALDFIDQQKVSLIKGDIMQIKQNSGNMQSIITLQPDGHTKEIPIKALYVMPPVMQSLDLQSNLGYKLTPSGHIEVDAYCKTSVAGLYAAGDNSNPFRSLAAAMNAGMTAGAMINFDLINKIRPLPKM